MRGVVAGWCRLGIAIGEFRLTVLPMITPLAMRVPPAPDTCRIADGTFAGEAFGEFGAPGGIS